MAINWNDCLDTIKHELEAEQFNMWLKPLASHFDGETLYLYAANKFVLGWVRDEYFTLITQTLKQLYGADTPLLSIIDGKPPVDANDSAVVAIKTNTVKKDTPPSPKLRISDNITSRNRQGPSYSRALPVPSLQHHNSNVNPKYTFDNFVEGKSNQLARAAATQVSQNPGVTYNPLFLYGGTGLGKTHLIHAIGNGIVEKNPNAKIVYMHSERFVQDMVKALQNNAIEDFKRFYRSVDALLIDDIQLFANKDRSQEEFFHTFNALLEGNQQIILTSDRYPKEIDGVEERLKSRFGWGLTVIIEPPELETRVAILLSKAKQNRIELPHEVAFYGEEIALKCEGARRRVK